MARRMIDHLLADGAMQHDARTGTYHQRSMTELVTLDGRPALPAAEVFVLDQVTRYLYEAVPREDWGVEDFPHCAPPGPVFWMETRAPREIVNEAGSRPWTGHYAWGVLFRAMHTPTILRDPAFPSRVTDGLSQACVSHERAVRLACARHHYPVPDREPAEGGAAWVAAAPHEVQHALVGLTTVVQLLAAARHVYGNPALAAAGASLRWTYTVVPFFQMHPSAPIVDFGLVGVLNIDTQGRLVEVPTPSHGKSLGSWFVMHGEYLPAAAHDQYVTVGRISLYPMLLALSWMQEAGTTLTPVDPCHQGSARPPTTPCRRRHYTLMERTHA